MIAGEVFREWWETVVEGWEAASRRGRVRSLRLGVRVWRGGIEGAINVRAVIMFYRRSRGRLVFGEARKDNQLEENRSWDGVYFWDWYVQWKDKGYGGSYNGGGNGGIREINGHWAGLVLMIDCDGDSRGELWVRHTRIVVRRDKMIEGLFLLIRC